MRRVMKLAPALLAGVLVMSACGGDDDETPGAGGTTSAPTTSDLKVGLAYDIGGRGDQSFNDSAAAGLDKAKTDFGISEDNVNELEASAGETDAQKEERLRQLAEGGYNPIIAVGFAYSGPLGKVAADFPDVKFAIIDDAQAKGANIANLTFAENEGSYLVGVAAALKSTANHIGFVGGVDVPLIHKFEAGFKAGAQAVKPDIKIDSTYLTQPPDFTGFNDAAKGQTAADGMFDAGADVVYHAAGGSGGGVFTAAQEAGKWAIGVDSDQALTADPAVRDVILTSMLKQVNNAVYNFIESMTTDSFKAGETVFDLASDGVGYSTTGGHVDDIKAQIDEYKQKIISGEITVPTS